MSPPILLPAPRVTGYLRALDAALDALGPNADFVPFQQARDTVALLDPTLCADLLDPAEADPRSGMPSWAWLSRATGLVRAQRDGRAPSADDVARARTLDPTLADRLDARRRVHAFSAEREFLPGSRLRGAVRRRGATTDFLLTFDRITPDALWLRVRIDLTGPAGWESRGPITLEESGAVTLDDGLNHLLGRHLLTPITALRHQLQDGTGALVSRIARCTLGPFWFPGVRLPTAVPDRFGRGLVLHATSEVLGQQVRHSRHADPLGGPPSEPVPDGYGVFRDRRFAASRALAEDLDQWCRSRGAPTVVHPI